MDVNQAMAKLCPSAAKGQRQVLNTRQRGLVIPKLEKAREEFELYIGGKVQWEVQAAQDDSAKEDSAKGHYSMGGGDDY